MRTLLQLLLLLQSANDVIVQGDFVGTGGITYSVDPTGNADSTQAIQLAFQKAMWVNLTDEDSYVRAQSVPTVRFPSGRYKISDTIRVFPVCVIEGSKAIITQTDATKVSFDLDGATDVTIKGIRFDGGATAVSIRNKNVNGSVFLLEECRFDNIKGPAVIAKGSGDGNIMSANLSLIRCRARLCDKLLVTYCDQTLIDNCWNQWSQSAPAGSYICNMRGDLSIVNRTMFVPQDFTAFPIMHTWISSAGASTSVTARDSRFSGEFGGIPIITNGVAPNDPGGVPSSVYVTRMSTSVSFHNCQLSAGPSKNTTSAVLNMQMPCAFTLENNSYLIDVPIVTMSGTAKAMLPKLQNKLKVKISRNQSWPDIDANWPSSSRCPSELFPYMVR